MHRGFLLQPTYRTENGRPVVTLYGVLESGGSFLVRDDRQTPRFFVRAADADRAAALGARIAEGDRAAAIDAPVADAVRATRGAPRAAQSRPRTTMAGDPVVAVDLVMPSDAPPLRNKLQDAGIECFEADVRFAYRYLIDRGIRAAFEIHGPARPGTAFGVDHVFENPEIRPASFTPKLKVLSFDIETDPKARRLLSISLAGCGVNEVMLFTPEGFSCPDGALPYPTERSLIEAFVRRVRELDPDILTGWNVIDFDLSVLLRLAKKFGVRFAIGRGNDELRIRLVQGSRNTVQAVLPGRVVLDGIELLRGAFIRMESYSLGAAAQEILGRDKIIGGPDRAEEILDAFRHDRERFVAYNLADSRLVLDIFERLKLIELTVERSLLTGMPPDRVAASIASFDFLYLTELAKQGIVAPTVRSSDSSVGANTGGTVLEPVPGLHDNVIVADFKSLYPSLIRTFQIDPLGRIPEPGPDDDPITAPNGAHFRREPGILPRLLDDLFPRRDAAKAAGNAVASQAIKILMNSFYGVLGTPACRFAHKDLANAITWFGHTMLTWSKAWIERRGHTVLYGDTDSLFILSGVSHADEAARVARTLVADLNRDLADHIRKTWRVESRLELQFDRLYARLFLPALRGSTAGARKRYVGLVRKGGSEEVVFTGMEVVRRDWTDLARELQRDLYGLLFTDRPVEERLRTVVADLRAGKLDDRIVYRKGLRKDVDEYTASTPPHVSAARKMKGPPGHIIEYVMTKSGPEPAAERASPIDYEHYVQKQVRPVAEPVLDILGLGFDRVVGDDRQMELF